MDQLLRSFIEPSFTQRGKDLGREQLTKSAELELLYQTAPIGMCLIDRDLRYARINEMLASINGKPIEDHIGRTIYEINPEIAPKLEPIYRGVIETGDPLLNIVVCGTTPATHNEERHWLASYYPIRDEEGTVQFVSTVVQDITQLERAKLDLQRINQNLEALLEGTNAVPWEANAKTCQFTYVGPQVVELLGYPVERWLERDFWVEHIHPDDREFAIEYCAQSSFNYKDYEFEYRMIASDGGIIWVHDIVNVEWVNGEPEILRGFMIDITERKRIEVQLRESEERFRVTADSAPVMIWMSGPDKLCNYFNKGWLEFTGRTMGEELGSSWAENVHPDDLKLCLETYTDSFDARREFRMEYRLKRSDGEYRWILDNGIPRFLSDGTFAGYIGSCIDITDHKKSERELKKTFVEIKRLKDQLQAENVYLREEIKLEYRHDEFVSNSSAIKTVLRQVEQVAKTGSAVLILGETGTGKELLAHVIHSLSNRNAKAMVKVNCAALPSTLIESELFGREKGAYTGALTRQIGRFELANGSTIFLDEVGELPLDLQAKLLRVLQEGQFERLGSPATIKVDVRVIAATNKDLSKAVPEGRFREDLYYRLNVFPIYVPPLRERREDIPALVWTFVKEFGEKMGKIVERIPKKTMETLQSYFWPGNIRELRNVVERAMILNNDSTLHVQLPSGRNLGNAQRITLKELERKYMIEVLEMTGWRVRGQKGAAEVLGLKPSTLESRMSKLGIKRKK